MTPDKYNINITMKLQQISNKLIFLLFFIPGLALAISSANYQLDPLNVGNAGGIESNSGNFNLDRQQVGDVSVDVSNSADFNIRHGHLYPEGGEVTINFTVIPEKRIPPTGNDSTRVLIYVYSVGSTIPIHVYSYYDTDNNGHYNGLVLTGISPGTYDLAVKGYAHLRKRLNNVVLNSGVNDIDFSAGGTEKLLCGDVYVNASYPDGDNMVNSVDVTYLTSRWAIMDSGVSDERADVDENGQVNSLDMTKVVNNYALVGD